MTAHIDDLVRRLLDTLEDEETKLLSWGLVDGGFSGDEILDFAQAVVDAADAEVSASELRQELFNRRLLFAFQNGGADINRTRMAESVRLFAKLRQIFPNRPWQLAPTLVADFRFARRPRLYPRREIVPAVAIGRLTDEVRLSPVRRLALGCLLREGQSDPLKLAEFQFQATRRMLLDMDARSSRGLIIGAGTGTGKTLAFYIPALTHLAGLVERQTHWTKAVAIYPRNELLKDQLSETYAQVRQLDGLLLAEAGRKLSIGAFFGPTPWTANDLKSTTYKKWGKPRSNGYICPFLRCPKCEGELVWRMSDLEKENEVLYCIAHGCGGVVSGDEVILTRKRMTRTPPDVLFTTTEMLNRQMGDSSAGHVFGLGPNTRRPHLMLLDEVHTYSGTTGAQVALLLRRWQHAVGSKVQFTGLSATLRAAPEYFGRLVGLRAGAVDEVSPRDSELDPIPKSVEYVLALRGDPVAGASLLSTSIQATMLLRRVLDPDGMSPSQGLFGQRVFLFTDDLDVTNRLYNNIQDAEGLDSWGGTVPGGTVLASLRSTSQPDNSVRFPLGQSWQLCEDIGHPFGLARPLRLSRTSSQDTGVEQGSDVVVATAALEVGYNDPDVGAVLQHKAPRDWAAFLQRKGRAGRRPTMRPWTTVVLSDYGRDRLAYQAYDQLFDPQVPFRALPVGNRYILRMQAAFTLMDWIARELPTTVPQGSVWTDFSRPAVGGEWWLANIRERQSAEIDILAEVLDGNDARCRSLERYLRSALALTAEELQSVLWDPPRPLLTAVIPTLVRRLESGWRRVQSRPSEPPLDIQVNDHPLPDFVPHQLFGDLNLPEVEVVLDPMQRGHDGESAFLPLVQALRTLAPGRVTRRFGYLHARAHHWVQPPDLQLPQQDMPVEAFCEQFDAIGNVQVRDGDEVRSLPCIRPRTIHPSKPPGIVGITSNAQLEWKSQISPANEDVRLRFEPPRGTGWEAAVSEIGFFTHGEQNHVRVQRFAIASHATLTFLDGSQSDLTVRFVERDTGNPAAVGFDQQSDGIVFRFTVPADIGLDPDHPNQRKVRAFRTGYFRERVQRDPTLQQLANSFQQEWLAQIYLSALVSRADEDNIGIAEAHHRLHTIRTQESLAAVLSTIFQTIELPTGAQIRQKVHDTLLTLCQTAAVINALGAIAPILWELPDAGWHQWAAARYRATLGGALLEACLQSCPHMEAGDLYLDIDCGPRPPDAPGVPAGYDEIWITESTIGGGGVVEELLRTFTADPRRFFRIATSALAATDFEIVDRELTRLLQLTQANSRAQEAFAAVRSASDHAGLAVAATGLRRMLGQCGVVVNHPVMSAIHSRILRPGSTPATDGLLDRLVGAWSEAEARLGIELDPRVYAFVAAQSARVKADLGTISYLPASDPVWRYQAVCGLLWPRGYQTRSQGLTFYNPFADAPTPDREILLDLIRASEPTVSLANGWESAVAAALTDRGTARLIAASTDRIALKQAILALAAAPVEANFLHLYPSVVALSYEPDQVSVTLDLQEVIT
jgi:hypothetical protein